MVDSALGESGVASFARRRSLAVESVTVCGMRSARKVNAGVEEMTEAVV